MMKYNIHVCGTVADTESDFRCGFDFTVANGGSVKHVGKCLQDAINGMKEKGHPIEQTVDNGED